MSQICIEPLTSGMARLRQTADRWRSQWTNGLDELSTGSFLLSAGLGKQFDNGEASDDYKHHADPDPSVEFLSGLVP